MLKNLGDRLVDFLFPPFCVSCNQAGEWWCPECRHSIQPLVGRICPKCLSLSEHICHGEMPFAHVWAFGYYHDPKLRAAITALKFHGTSALMNNLVSFLRERHPSDLPTDTVLVPMPLSAKRLKERGFNQAELIARAVQSTLLPQTKVSSCLMRVGHRAPQSSISHDELVERQKNVCGCFEAVGQIPTNIIILVDDVITTGATAAEAAKTLLAAGSETVSVLALAIGA